MFAGCFIRIQKLALENSVGASFQFSWPFCVFCQFTPRARIVRCAKFLDTWGRHLVYIFPVCELCEAFFSLCDYTADGLKLSFSFRSRQMHLHWREHQRDNAAVLGHDEKGNTTFDCTASLLCSKYQTFRCGKCLSHLCKRATAPPSVLGSKPARPVASDRMSRKSCEADNNVKDGLRELFHTETPSLAPPTSTADRA